MKPCFLLWGPGRPLACLIQVSVHSFFFLSGVGVGFLSWLFLGFLWVSASFDCPFVFGIFHCVGGLGRLVHFVCAVVFLMARLCGRCLLVLQAAYASCVCPV